VPKSHGRKKDSSDAREPVARAPKGPSPVWLAPLMLVLFAVGVLWLLVYYVSGGSAPVLRELGAWNLAVGFGFIVAGFALSTQWR
jgi:hypothetical protein